MLPHGSYLGNDGFACPFHSENPSQFLEVLCSSLSYREDRVAEPAHAESTEFFVEEFDTKLTRKKGYIFDDS